MAMPSTPMLDDFHRPDEDPLSWNGKWLRADTSFADSFRVVSNSLEAEADLGGALYYWGQQAASGPTEVWARAKVLGTVGVACRLQQVGGTGSAAGYLLYSTATSCTLARVQTGMIFAVLFTSTSASVALQAGDLTVLRATGPILTVYRIRGTTVGQIVTVRDTTYATGQIGVYGENAQIASFGGGDRFVAPTHPVSGFGGM